jgi:hypothetical protein
MALELSVLFFILLLAGVCLAFTRKCASPGQLPATPDWLEDLSCERYRPMLRLLDDEEIRILRLTPGFTPRMERRLRIQRCRLFREYLSDLDADFKLVCAALRALLVQSQNDRPDLALTLVRSQAAFAYGKFTVQTRLLLYRWNLGSIDAARLLEPFEQMRLEMGRLVPAGVAVGI